MPPQARVGDKSLVPADAHGCVACPHTALGPAVNGSANVLVNGRPAIRVADPGIHAACCGPNVWHAKTGSRSVLINGRPAHRLGDLVNHCGGLGQTTEGSLNVLVGDYSGSGAARSQVGDPAATATLVIQLRMNALPIRRAEITVDGAGSRKTDDAGWVTFSELLPGRCVVKFGERGIWTGKLAPGSRKQLLITVPLFFIGCSAKKFRPR